MKNKLFKTFVTLLTVILISPSTFAYSPSIESGISWLSANQNADGSWGSNADLTVLDTSTALDTLKY